MVHWLRSGLLVTSGVTEVSSGTTVTSTLRLDSLRREDHGMLLMCEAKNNNISRPVSKAVSIVMNCEWTTINKNSNMRISLIR